GGSAQYSSGAIQRQAHQAKPCPSLRWPAAWPTLHGDRDAWRNGLSLADEPLLRRRTDRARVLRLVLLRGPKELQRRFPHEPGLCVVVWLRRCPGPSRDDPRRRGTPARRPDASQTNTVHDRHRPADGIGRPRRRWWRMVDMAAPCLAAPSLMLSDARESSGHAGGDSAAPSRFRSICSCFQRVVTSRTMATAPRTFPSRSVGKMMENSMDMRVPSLRLAGTARSSCP